MARVQRPIAIPEPVNDVDSLWRTTQALKEAVEVIQGIRGNREYALKADLNDVNGEINNIIVNGGASSFFDLTDTDITLQAQGDFTYNADGTEWQVTGLNMRWNPASGLELGNDIALSWYNESSTLVELVNFTAGDAPSTFNVFYDQSLAIESETTSGTVVAEYTARNLTGVTAGNYLLLAKAIYGTLQSGSRPATVALYDGDTLNTRTRISPHQSSISGTADPSGEHAYFWAGPYTSAGGRLNFRYAFQTLPLTNGAIVNAAQFLALDLDAIGAGNYQQEIDGSTGPLLATASRVLNSVTIGDGTSDVLVIGGLISGDGFFGTERLTMRMGAVGSEYVVQNQQNLDHGATMGGMLILKAPSAGTTVNLSIENESPDRDLSIVSHQLIAIELDAFAQYRATFEQNPSRVFDADLDSTYVALDTYTAADTRTATVIGSYAQEANTNITNNGVHIVVYNVTTASIVGLFGQNRDATRYEFGTDATAEVVWGQFPQVAGNQYKIGVCSEDSVPATTTNANLVVFGNDLSTSPSKFIVGNATTDTDVLGTNILLDGPTTVSGAATLNSTLQVESTSVFNNGSTWNVQTGVSPITIDGDIGDTTTPLINILNQNSTFTPVRRLMQFREDAATGWFIDWANNGFEQNELVIGNTYTGDVVSPNMTIGADGQVDIGATNQIKLITASTNSDATMQIDALGDAAIILNADTNNAGEDDIAYVSMSQDGGATNAYVGMSGTANSLGDGVLTGTPVNSLVILNRLLSGSTATENALVLGSKSTIQMIMDGEGVKFLDDIVAGTVNADFDAVTASSYGGILEANLLDKTVNETISGQYSFTDTAFFSDAAGIGTRLANANYHYALNLAGSANVRLIGLSSSDQIIIGDSTAVGTYPIQMADNVIIAGDLTVQGTTTTIDSTVVDIADNIITLNAGEVGAPTQNAGIEIERGTSANVIFQWDETADQWLFNEPVNVVGALTAASYDGILAANLLDKTASETITGTYTFPTARFNNVFGDDDTTNLTIFGGIGTGANIELYGGSHPTLNDRIYIDAVSHNFRSQNGATTFSVFNSTVAQFNVPLNLQNNDINEARDITASSVRGDLIVPNAGNTQSVTFSHSGTELDIDASAGTQGVDVNGVNYVSLGNYRFNADQTVGAAQDTHVLTYDNATGEIGLAAAPGAGSGTLPTGTVAGSLLRWDGVSDWVEETSATLSTSGDIATTGTISINRSGVGSALTIEVGNGANTARSFMRWENDAGTGQWDWVMQGDTLNDVYFRNLADNTLAMYFDQSANVMWLRDGWALRLSDSTDVDSAEFRHDGTDFNTTFLTTTAWNVSGALYTKFVSDGTAFGATNAEGDLGPLVISNEGLTAGNGVVGQGIDFLRIGSGLSKKASIAPVQTTTDSDSVALAFFAAQSSVGADPVVEWVRVGLNNGVAGLSVFDVTGVDNARFSHDGTNFNTLLTGTGSWSIDGLTTAVEITGGADLWVRDGAQVRAYDPGDNYYTYLRHNGVQGYVGTDGLGGDLYYEPETGLNRFFRSGVDNSIWVYDDTGTEYIRMLVSGTTHTIDNNGGRDMNIRAGGAWRSFSNGQIGFAAFGNIGSTYSAMYNANGTEVVRAYSNRFQVMNGIPLRILDSTNTDRVDMQHDGTDLNVIGVNTGLFDIQDMDVALNSYKLTEIDAIANLNMGPWHPMIGQIIAQGRSLTPNPEFAGTDINGVQVYDNASTGTVTRTQGAGSTLDPGINVPNGTGNIIEVSWTGLLDPIPFDGGFRLGITGVENHTYVWVFLAKVPLGASLNPAQNPNGNNASRYWLTNNLGTGKYEWYAYLWQYGEGGTIGSAGFMSVNNSGAAWDVQIAYSNYLDVTDSSSRILQPDAGGTLRVMDATRLDWVDFSHDGTDLQVVATNTTDLNFGNGATGWFKIFTDNGLEIWDATVTDNIRVRHNGGFGLIETSNDPLLLSSGSGLIRTDNGDDFAVYGSGGVANVLFDHDNTNLNIVGTSTSRIQFEGVSSVDVNLVGGLFRVLEGSGIQIWSSGNADSASIGNTGSNLQFTSGDVNFQFSPLTNTQFISGKEVRFNDSDNNAWMSLQHDGTDFNMTGTSTSAININVGTLEFTNTGTLIDVSARTALGTFLLAPNGSGGISNITNQGGLGFYCDSSMLLHAGDNYGGLLTDLGIIGTTTSETLFLTSDGDVRLISNRQTNYGTSYTLSWTNAGELRFNGSGAPDANYLAIRQNGAAQFDLIGSVGFAQINNSTGADTLRIRDSGGAGAAANPWISFRDSAETRLGYVGFGSIGNSDIYLTSDSGNVQLQSSSGVGLILGAQLLFETDTRVRDGNLFRIYNTGNTDRVDMNHDGTDFRMNGVNTRLHRFLGHSQGLAVDTPGSIYMREAATAQGDFAGWGQLWVKNDTPNTLFFTNDAGTDIQISPPTGTLVNSMLRYNGTAFVEETDATLDASGNLYLRNGGDFRAYGPGNAQYASVTHNNTDGTFGATNGLAILSGNTGSQMNAATSGRAIRTQTGTTGVTSTANIRDGDTGSAFFYDIGFNVLPPKGFNTSINIGTAGVGRTYVGKAWGKTNTTARTLTGPTSAQLDFPVGGVMTIMNLGSSGSLTLNDTSTCTMFISDGAGNTDIAGSATVAAGGIVTLYRYSATAIYLFGSGLNP